MNSIQKVAMQYLAKEFRSKEELAKYLKDHPNADKKNHSVKKQKEAPKSEEPKKISWTAKLKEKAMAALAGGKKLIHAALKDQWNGYAVPVKTVYHAVTNRKLTRDQKLKAIENAAHHIISHVIDHAAEIGFPPPAGTIIGVGKSMILSKVLEKVAHKADPLLKHGKGKGHEVSKKGSDFNDTFQRILAISLQDAIKEHIEEAKEE